MEVGGQDREGPRTAGEKWKDDRGPAELPARRPTGLSAGGVWSDPDGRQEPQARRARLGRLIPSDPDGGNLSPSLVSAAAAWKLRPPAGSKRDSRKVQTLFGTITVDAPRIRVCSCRAGSGFVDVSQSPLAELIPDRCTPELRRLQAELSARHSYRESARLLETLLPCGSVNHATMRNRTHRIADDLEAAVPSPPEPDPNTTWRPISRWRSTELHIRAAHGYQARHIDVTVGKIEVAGKPPRRFALAPKGADRAFGDIAQSAAGTRMAAWPSRLTVLE